MRFESPIGNRELSPAQIGFVWRHRAGATSNWPLFAADLLDLAGQAAFGPFIKVAQYEIGFVCHPGLRHALVIARSESTRQSRGGELASFDTIGSAYAPVLGPSLLFHHRGTENTEHRICLLGLHSSRRSRRLGGGPSPPAATRLDHSILPVSTQLYLFTIIRIEFPSSRKIRFPGEKKQEFDFMGQWLQRAGGNQGRRLRSLPALVCVGPRRAGGARAVLGWPQGAAPAVWPPGCRCGRRRSGRRRARAVLAACRSRAPRLTCRR